MEIIYANAACARLLGLDSPADVIGQSPLAFSPAYNHDAVKHRMSMANSTGRSTPRESEWRRRDGSPVAVEVEALIVEYNGEPASVVIARDLTERRAMIARTAAADRMLAHATLAAGVAHEVNGPLAFLVTNLSILADELPGLFGSDARLPRRSRADIERLLGDAQEGAMRVRDVVRDLRLFVRPAEEGGAHCDLGDVLSSCMKTAWRDVDGRARIVSDIRTMPPVRGSASRLAQVFLNLIVNAAHAIAPDRPDENEIKLTARLLDPTNVIVELTDTGSGMAPETVARIFEPFFTTKPVGSGTGLGLAICQAVIASIGGTITIESELGKGTRCAVILPLAPEQTEPAVPRETPGTTKRGRILVVDDEPAFTSSLRILLDEHEVAAFTSARLALERIRTDPSFDLVLCDLTMPDLSGMQFHAKVTEIAPTLAKRMIFVTGGAITAEAEAFLAQHAAMTLEKPFFPAELTALVARFVSGG